MRTPAILIALSLAACTQSVAGPPHEFGPFDGPVDAGTATPSPSAAPSSSDPVDAGHIFDCDPLTDRCHAGSVELCDGDGIWRGSFGSCTATCAAPPGRFHIDIRINVVTDKKTGLDWYWGSQSTNTQSAAIYECATSTQGGFTDWRLPIPAEFAGLIASSGCSPVLDQAALTDLSGRAWTSANNQVYDQKTGTPSNVSNEAEPLAEVRCVRP